MATILGALLLIMTPGGRGHLQPDGWMYASTGRLPGGSAAVYFPTGVRGLSARVWEDGSFRIRRGKRTIMVGCIRGKGCK